MATVICVGCGMMGSRLVQAFLDEKHDVAVVNRTRERVLPFERQGAKYYVSLSDAVKKVTAKLIVMNVSDYDVSTAIICQDPETVRGKIIVNVSTGEAKKVSAFQQLIEDAGGSFLCGVLTCYPRNIGPHGNGSIVFAGNADSYRQAAPILAALSPFEIFVGEDPTKASIVDTAWLTTHYGLYWGIIQGAAACKGNGIDVAHYADAIKIMTTALLDMICENIKKTVAVDTYDAASDCEMSMQVASIGEIVRGLEHAGFDAGPLQAIGLLAEKAAAAGDGDKNFEALAKHLQR